MTIILDLRYVFGAFLVFHMAWSFTPAKDDMHACFGIGSEFLVLLLFKPLSLCLCAATSRVLFFFLVPGSGLLALFARVDCLLIYLWIYQYTHTQGTRREPDRLVLGWAGSSVCYEAHMYGAVGWLGAFRVSLAMGCMYR